MGQGFDLAFIAFAVALLGLGVDRWAGTAPLFMIIGLIAGMIGGVWRIYRANSGSSND